MKNEGDDVRMGDGDLLTVMTMPQTRSILQRTWMILMKSIRALVNIPEAQTHGDSFIKVQRWIRSQHQSFQMYVHMRLANWGRL